MKADTQVPETDSIESLTDQPDTSIFDGPVDPDTIARSDANILRWREYLPEDCIAAMIAMKWDVTT